MFVTENKKKKFYLPPSLMKIFLWKSMKISLKNRTKIFRDFQGFTDILLSISQLFAEYLCSFIHTFKENTISPLENTDFLV